MFMILISPVVDIALISIIATICITLLQWKLTPKDLKEKQKEMKEKQKKAKELLKENTEESRKKAMEIQKEMLKSSMAMMGNIKVMLIPGLIFLPVLWYLNANYNMITIFGNKIYWIWFYIIISIIVGIPISKIIKR